MLSWSYSSWIYNYLCNQCLSPLMLWVRISIRVRGTTLCDKVCQYMIMAMTAPLTIVKQIRIWHDYTILLGIKFHDQMSRFQTLSFVFSEEPEPYDPEKPTVDSKPYDLFYNCKRGRHGHDHILTNFIT